MNQFIEKIDALSQTTQQGNIVLRRWITRGRRCIHSIYNMAAGNPVTGPMAFLAVSTVVGISILVVTLYTPSYSVTVNGELLGIVESQDVVTELVTQVEEDGSELLGYDYQIQSEITYSFALTLNEEVTGARNVEQALYGELQEVGASLRKYQLTVDGAIVGVVESETELESMMNGILNTYHTEDTVDSDFVEAISIEPVYQANDVMTVGELQTVLTDNTTGETSYTVVSGDTFNGIAYRNDMSASELKALNPDLNINKLSIGDVLNVKEIIPFLSVATTEDVVYSESIPCPVKEVKDNTIYEGSSKIVEQGVEGESRVMATITYINGYESGREVESTTTVREPTVTTKAIGTATRPKTASYGSYIWPYTGRINSYYGGRTIFGSYNYHSGIDIAGTYGANVVAADGGTVTFAGWKGSYGNLVIITHDNGTKTYYGHNSSLIVSAGDKVYRGQPIAKIGSTGRSTGNHVHFEMRVNGSSVNPLSYLP